MINIESFFEEKLTLRIQPKLGYLPVTWLTLIQQDLPDLFLELSDLNSVNWGILSVYLKVLLLSHIQHLPLEFPFFPSPHLFPVSFALPWMNSGSMSS